ncbi:MAG TPA: catalase family peroxidase [Polyangiaceae bacterium]|jgi:catalase|nr:catalase family peroxidase [Polyangiaceae bacterium]
MRKKTILSSVAVTAITAAIVAGSAKAAPPNADRKPEALKSSPKDLVDALHTAFGDNHSRAVHAKGIILSGEFTPDPAAAALTRAPHLQKTRSQVTVRFSDFTGIPTIPDNNPAANPRGFAIKFSLPGGSVTDIVGHSFDGFPTSNSDQFRELLLAIGASGPDAAEPTALSRFLEVHPVAKTFLTTQKLPASYATVDYFGVNAFKFTNASGAAHFVRYQFLPVGGEQLLSNAEFTKAGPDYLQTEIKRRIARGPIRFQLVAQLAEAGDKFEDPSIAWPATREKVPLGMIEIRHLAANTPEQDKALSFSPNRIPDGIETADPMLDFRARAYPISVKGRQ